MRRWRRIVSSRGECCGSMPRSRSARGRSRRCSRSSRRAIRARASNSASTIAWSIRIGNLSDSSLIARRIAPCRIEVCAAPSYLETHGIPQTVSSLSAHNCLGYTLSQRTPVDRWAFGARGEVSVRVSGNLRANNGDALLAGALAGQGIIHQPSFIVADDLRAGRLVALTLDHPNVELGGIYAVYLPDRHPPAKVRAFIDFIAVRFAPDPPWDRDLAGNRVAATR